MVKTPENQLRGFIAKFDPAMAKLIRDCRASMRKLFPTANELVYDNYNFFVIGYGPTECPSDCVVSIAADRNGIRLNFLQGRTLPDPRGVLQDTGGQNRFVPLEEAATLSKAEVRDLVTIAALQARQPFLESGNGKLIIRSVSKKQRPRR